MYVAKWAGSNLGTLAPVTGTNVNTDDGTEDYPALTPDALNLYFGSTRPGGAGSYDIYLSTRASIVDGFGMPTAVTELNTTASEHVGWVSPDNCVISRNVSDSSSNYELFTATRGM